MHTFVTAAIAIALLISVAVTGRSVKPPAATGATCAWNYPSLPPAQSESDDILLWTPRIPGASTAPLCTNFTGANVFSVNNPYLRRYAANATGQFVREKLSVLCIAGGGFATAVVRKESTPCAQQMANWGMNAYELVYRFPLEWDNTQPNEANATIPMYVAQFQDTQRALQVIGTQTGVDPTRIGVIGFSDGAYLGSMLVADPKRDWNTGFPRDDVPTPYFAAFLYPVITMDSSIKPYPKSRGRIGFAHSESVRYTRDETGPYSADVRLAAHNCAAAPYTFLAQCEADSIASVTNSQRMYAAVKSCHGSAAVDQYIAYPASVCRDHAPGEHSSHGWGMGTNATGTSDWPHQFNEWLKTVLAPAKRQPHAEL